jgi:menaquinone-dependent protoporphyrinogen IX oxidase
MAAAKPRVLIVYYSFTQQARRVAEATADVLRDRGCEVRLAAIEFTDERYADRFSNFPFRRVYHDLFSMLSAQLRRATGKIRFPEEALIGDYDLVCIGSPTWWLTTCMPIRSFMMSEAAGRLLKGKHFAAFVVCRRYWRNNLNTVKKLGIKQGGIFVEGIHFVYEGGQVRSMLSLISFLGTGEYRQRYFGVKIPPTNLKVDFSRPTREFANRLADSLGGLVQIDTAAGRPHGQSSVA